MRRWLVWTTITTLSAAGLVAACTTKTGLVGTSAGGLKDRVLALANTSYQRNSKAHHVHKDTLLTHTRLKLKVVNFDGDVGLSRLATKASEETGAYTHSFSCDSAYGGEAPHPIAISETTYPPMSDHPDESTIVDQATGNTRTFTADHEFMKFTISDGTSTLTIVTNPDGTYTIDGKPAASDAAAAKLIMASPMAKGTSIESLAALLGALSLREQSLMAQTLGAAQMGLGQPGDPVPLVEACIEELEKDPATPAPVPASATANVATFHGKIYDDRNELVTSTAAVFKAELLNGATFPDGSTSLMRNGFMGQYAFNGVPAGASVRITVTVNGWEGQTRTVTVKANPEGDPTANVFNFGGPTSGPYALKRLF